MTTRAKKTTTASAAKKPAPKKRTPAKKKPAPAAKKRVAPAKKKAEPKAAPAAKREKQPLLSTFGAKVTGNAKTGYKVAPAKKNGPTLVESLVGPHISKPAAQKVASAIIAGTFDRAQPVRVNQTMKVGGEETLPRPGRSVTLDDCLGALKNLGGSGTALEIGLQTAGWHNTIRRRLRKAAADGLVEMDTEYKAEGSNRRTTLFSLPAAKKPAPARRSRAKKTASK